MYNIYGCFHSHGGIPIAEWFDWLCIGKAHDNICNGCFGGRPNQGNLIIYNIQY